MRILFINQFFWPDGAPTAVLLEDVGRALVEAGHDVIVVCGNNRYAATRSDTAPPIRIVRVPSFAFGRNRVQRLISWISFLFCSMARSLIINRVDVVVTLTTPPALSLIGVVLKKLKSTRFWIWEMDLYPDVAAAVGAISRERGLYSVLHRAFYAIRRQADGVIVLGDCMRRHIAQAGVPANRIHTVETWADDRFITPAVLPPCRPLYVLYSGNLGLAHEIETINHVMLRLRDRADFQFIFAGGGVRTEEVRRFCANHGIENVSFRTYATRNNFSESLGACHLGLVTLRPECAGFVVPSKIYSFLAARRPIVYVGPKAATPGQIVSAELCGWHFDPGDIDGIVDLLEKCASSPSFVDVAANRAYEAFRRKYNRSQGVKRMVQTLAAPSFVEPSPPPPHD